MRKSAGTLPHHPMATEVPGVAGSKAPGSILAKTAPPHTPLAEGKARRTEEEKPHGSTIHHERPRHHHSQR